MYTLGIETSCDETSVGIVENGVKVKAHIIYSQIDKHKIYGGVVPELASRLHVTNVFPVLTEALEIAGLTWKDISLVTATQGPGLLGALSTGFMVGKTLALALQLPFVGVHHIEGHIYANLLDTDNSFQYPLLALIASGGHTQLLLINKEFHYELIGNTIDDAIGEAFDKSARTLGLGYPGGPIIDKLAQTGNRKTFAFPKVQTPGKYDFSFSGLKSAVLRMNQQLKFNEEPRGSQVMADFCASFQEKLVSELTSKTFEAAQNYGIKNILIAGGVSANSFLREEISKMKNKYTIYLPELKYCTDNGAMIAGAGYCRYKAGFATALDSSPVATWSLAKYSPT